MHEIGRRRPRTKRRTQSTSRNRLAVSANPWPCTRNNRKTNEGSHAYLPATSKNQPWHRDETKLSLEFCSVNLCVSSFHQSFVPLVKTSVWSSPIRMCSFVSCWSGHYFWFLGLSRCVFVPKFRFQIICRFRIAGFKFACIFRFVVFRVWYWDFSWIEFRIDVFQAVVCGTVFSTIPAGLPGPGALSLGYSFALFIFAEEAQYNLARNVRLKNSETGVLGTRKIETGEYCCVTRVQFWKLVNFSQ